MGTVRIRREMGCTRAECLAWLQQAFGVRVERPDTQPFTIAIEGGVAEVTLRELPVRKLGSITVPTLGVEFAFHDVTAAGRNAFLTRFERYTHRGGG